MGRLLEWQEIFTSLQYSIPKTIIIHTHISQQTAATSSDIDIYADVPCERYFLRVLTLQGENALDLLRI